MEYLELGCEDCGNERDFIETTTTVWQVSTNGDRENLIEEGTEYRCAKCKKIVKTETT